MIRNYFRRCRTDSHCSRVAVARATLLPICWQIMADRSQPDDCRPRTLKLAPVPYAPPVADETQGQAPSSAASKPATAKQQTRPKARAISAKGAILMYQDGVTVQFQKKCTECGYLDPSKSSMPIKPGTSRATFFCRKCRKLRHIEIQGIA
jgi:hypothetical protein